MDTNNFYKYFLVHLDLIPLKYIVYRSIFLNGTINTLPDDVKSKVMDLLEISKEEEEVFFQMEVAFQHYITGISLNNLYDKMNITNYWVDPCDLLNTIYVASAFLDEEKCIFQKEYWIQYKTNFSVDVKAYNGKKIKIELADKPALIRELEVFAVKDNVITKVEFTTNTDLLIYERYYYTSRPVVEVVPEDCDAIQVSYKVQKLEQNANEYIGTFVQHIREESELNWIKNSRSWKVVTFVKKLLGRK